MKKRSPSFSSLHGQLTNEVQNGVSIARPYDSLGRLAFVDLNAEAQSRREIECQPVPQSALVSESVWTAALAERLRHLGRVSARCRAPAKALLQVHTPVE